MLKPLTIEEFLALVRPGQAYVMRGVPGSGKTTIAEEIRKRFRTSVFSTDTYRMVNGKYVFDFKDSGRLHAKCLRHYCSELVNAHPEVIVCDNTNTTLREIGPYAAVANAFGYTPNVVTVRIDPEVAHARNAHDVPMDGVKRMYRRMESADKNMPGAWNPVDVEGVVDAD